MKELLRQKSIQLRRRGYSLAEISQRVKVAPSTVSLWVRHIVMNTAARRRLRQRSIMGRLKGAQTQARGRDDLLARLEQQARSDLQMVPISRAFQKLLCTLLLRCEGEKTTSHVVFINSDPSLIEVFLQSLREAFTIDEKKFRVSLHLHGYHKERQERGFWSQLTKIPASQFYKVYKKPNTGKSKHLGYHGCVSIRYYDHTIAKELDMLWKIFIKKYGRVV